MKSKFLKRFANSARKGVKITLALVVMGAVIGSGVYYTTASDSATIAYTTVQNITGPNSICKRITNSSGTGLSVYVPTTTTAEWTGFYGAPPAGVTIATCPTIISAWTNLGNLLPGVIGNSHSAVVGGYVYTFGGRTSTTGVTTAIYRASTAAPTTWTTVGNLPGPVHSGQLYNDGTYLYIFGGRSGESAGDTYYLNTIYRAPVSDPATGWVNTGSVLPSKLAYSHLVVPGDGYMYLLGGSISYETYNNVIYRAPVSNPLAWVNTGAVLPTTLTVSQALVTPTYIYLFGGRTGSGVFTNKIYRAPVGTPTVWTDTGSVIPVAMGFSTLEVVDDQIYLVGGYNGSSLSTVYKAPLSNPLSWTTSTPALPVALDSSTSEDFGGYIYLIGGGNNSAWATQTILRGTLTQ